LLISYSIVTGRLDTGDCGSSTCIAFLWSSNKTTIQQLQRQVSLMVTSCLSNYLY